MHPAHAHNTAAVQNQCSTVRDSMQSDTAAWRVASCWFVRLVCNGHAVAVRYTTLSTTCHRKFLAAQPSMPRIPGRAAPPNTSRLHPGSIKIRYRIVTHGRLQPASGVHDHPCTLSASCFPDLLGGTARSLRRPAAPALPCRGMDPARVAPSVHIDTPALTQPL